MVYRLLKVHDLITSPAYVVIKAADQFHTKATRNAKTKIFGDATGSAYTVIKGYTLVNASIGYRTPHWEVAVFARHLFDKDYMQNLTVQAGNSGLIVGTPSEPRLIGVTLRVRRQGYGGYGERWLACSAQPPPADQPPPGGQPINLYSAMPPAPPLRQAVIPGSDQTLPEASHRSSTATPKASG